jgi:hypothetical protein
MLKDVLCVVTKFRDENQIFAKIKGPNMTFSLVMKFRDKNQASAKIEGTKQDFQENTHQNAYEV